jgi:tetratricopeptide (TPR) repeat protein
LDEGAKQLTEAANLNSTVVKLFGEGKFDEALPLAKRVLEIRGRLLGADDERVASAMINIAEIYDAKKKFGDAQTSFERALAIYEKRFGPNDLRVANVLDRLGPVYFNRSLDPEAERALRRAVSIKEQILGAEDAKLANSLDNLGQFYRLRGDAKKAEPLFDRALMIMRKTLPEDSPATKNLAKHYSCLLYETRQTDKIKGLFHKYSPAKEIQDPDSSDPNGGVLNGRAVKLVTPSYPGEAERVHAGGVVVISVLIDETGKSSKHMTCAAPIRL